MLMFGIMRSRIAYIHTGQKLNAFHATCHNQALSHRNGSHPKVIIEYLKRILPHSHIEMDSTHHGSHPYVRKGEYTLIAPNKFPSCATIILCDINSDMSSS